MADLAVGVLTGKSLPLVDKVAPATLGKPERCRVMILKELELVCRHLLQRLRSTKSSTLYCLSPSKYA